MADPRRLAADGCLTETQEEPSSALNSKKTIVSDLLIRLVDAVESAAHIRRSLAELNMKPRYTEAPLRHDLEDKMAKRVQEVEEIQESILEHVD